ncbi:MAG: sulfotransferase [Pirellulales bacterium]
MAMPVNRVEIPETIPGEPASSAPRGFAFAGQLLLLHLLAAAALVVGLTAWPFYLVPRCLWGRPPITPSWRQFGRYLGLILTAAPPPPGLSWARRYAGLLNLLRTFSLAPLWGLCWYLDAAIFRRAWRQTEIIQPLFEISAARSGSTQLARYLEDDPHVVAPSVLQVQFPFEWLWRLSRCTLGRVMSAERVRKIMHGTMPPAFLQRHEMDPFRTDTIEMGLYGRHLIELSTMLGPEMMLQDFSLRKLQPHQRPLWEQDFVAFVDAIGKKTLHFAGPAASGQPRRLMVKGHFLASAPALAARFPDARFLALIRDPVPRLQSSINFLRVAPPLLGLGPTPWNWLVPFLLESEAEYSELEMAWYRDPAGPRKCVLFFQDYIRDLEGTMKKVYAECFDSDVLPPHVPTEHGPRQRTNYLVDRSLAQLGVDVPKLNARLAEYIEWCHGTATKPEVQETRA